jgi:hypothetical protein
MWKYECTMFERCLGVRNALFGEILCKTRLGPSDVSTLLPIFSGLEFIQKSKVRMGVKKLREGWRDGDR